MTETLRPVGETMAARYGYRCPRCGARTAELWIAQGMILEELACGVCKRELTRELVFCGRLLDFSRRGRSR